MEKPIAPDEGLSFMIPLEGGLASYTLDLPNPFEDPDMLEKVDLQSYFGEIGFSLSSRLDSGTNYFAISGGLSAFSYSGRAIGVKAAEQYGLNPRQDYQGLGGRFNFSLDRNYHYSDWQFCWRTLNIQISYAEESGSYSNYRNVAEDSRQQASYLDPLEHEREAVPGSSDFLSTHYYTELIFDYDRYGFVFGLGLINYLYQSEYGGWGTYRLSPTGHLGFNVHNFYARLNLGSLNPSAAIFSGSSSNNVMLGYRINL